MSLAFSPTLFFPALSTHDDAEAAAVAGSESNDSARAKQRQPPQSHQPQSGSAASSAIDLCTPSAAALALDCATIDALADRLQSLSEAAEGAAPPDAGQVSLLFGDRHCSKSRLLLQLSYRIAEAAASSGAVASASALSSASSANLRGDPFQPILLLLPKRRQNSPSGAQQSSCGSGSVSGGAKGASGSQPLLGLFGRGMRAEVLRQITIKWYTDDASLLSLLCELSLLSSPLPARDSSSAPALRIPPRFIGVLYDHSLTSEAAHMALVMARLSEGIAAINTQTQGAEAEVNSAQFAKCQCVFVMSHNPGVKRLRTLLPRYANCVYETTKVPGSSSDCLLWSRPCVSSSVTDLRALQLALEPVANLTTVTPLSSLHPPHHSPVTLSLSPLPGLPVIRYSSGIAAVDITRIYSL